MCLQASEENSEEGGNAALGGLPLACKTAANISTEEELRALQAENRTLRSTSAKSAAVRVPDHDISGLE